MAAKIFITIIFLLSFISNLFAPVGRIDITKIFIVVSYSPDNLCSEPQFIGIIDGLKEIQHSTGDVIYHKFIVKTFYMRTKLVFTTRSQIKSRAEIAKLMIESWNPKYIITIDDNAFEFVGIPESKDYTVLFTGINRKYSIYKEVYGDQLHDENVYGIEENLYIDKLLNLLKVSGLNFNTVYFLKPYRKYESSTERYVGDSLTQLFSTTHFSIKTYEIDSEAKLKHIFDKLNNKPSAIVIPILQRLIENGKPLGIKHVLHDIYKYNKKHLVLCFNPIFCEYGCGITNSINFYQSAKRLMVEILHKLLHNEQVQDHVLKPNQFLALNVKILNDLGMIELWTTMTSKIDKFYSHVKDIE